MTMTRMDGRACIDAKTEYTLTHSSVYFELIRASLVVICAQGKNSGRFILMAYLNKVEWAVQVTGGLKVVRSWRLPI